MDPWICRCDSARTAAADLSKSLAMDAALVRLPSNDSCLEVLPVWIGWRWYVTQSFARVTMPRVQNCG